MCQVVYITMDILLSNYPTSPRRMDLSIPEFLHSHKEYEQQCILIHSSLNWSVPLYSYQIEDH